MAFCPTCGSPADGRFCQKCGAALPAAAAGAPAPPPAAVTPAAAVGMTDNVAGALCYLFGFVTGILFLVLAPYNQNRNVRFHAFQSIFLCIAWFVAWIVLAVLGVALHVIPILGAILLVALNFALWIAALIVWLYMMIKTYNGEKIALPVIGPMAEKQAGAA
ncbi:MAG TPA: hypothetical protein VEV17_16615 [Bryobacteraceae bacterium]|nr:hypothetical protein [Bryobacteraceae bacterium]